jgi:hypothetical protein
MSGKFKKLAAEKATATPARVAIPQVDPGEPVSREEKQAVVKAPVDKRAPKSPEPTNGLFVEIPRSLAAWMGHYKVDSGHNKNEIATQALTLLKKKVESGSQSG